MADEVQDSLQAQFHRLVGVGMKEEIARAVVVLYERGKIMLDELDTGTMNALKEAPTMLALDVLAEFENADLSEVIHKAAFLCGMLKKAATVAATDGIIAQAQAQAQAQASSGDHVHTCDSVVGGSSEFDEGTRNLFYPSEAVLADPGLTLLSGRGPDPQRLQELLQRVPYSLELAVGRRQYSSPEDLDSCESCPSDTSGNEVFICRIPRDVFEDELLPLLETCGPVHQLKLMVDPATGWTRGFGFCKFASRDTANQAVCRLNDHELRSGRRIGVSLSQSNQRLFVSNIPKKMGKDKLFAEFAKHSPGLVDVIIYCSPDDRKKNRGFCFLEYESHRAAAIAKRKIESGRIRVWNCDIFVDWADPLQEPDEETMSKVKVLYVRNLTQKVTEKELKEAFEAHGVVERVKKMKDYAFIHFTARENASKALKELHGFELGGAPMEVTWAKPPSDKEKKDTILKMREQRMTHFINRGRFLNSRIHDRRNALGSPIICCSCLRNL